MICWGEKSGNGEKDNWIKGKNWGTRKKNNVIVKGLEVKTNDNEQWKKWKGLLKMD